jgi:hypothetical protein
MERGTPTVEGFTLTPTEERKKLYSELRIRVHGKMTAMMAERLILWEHCVVKAASWSDLIQVVHSHNTAQFARGLFTLS